MLAKLPEVVTGFRSGADALAAAHRGRLRGRKYRTASFNSHPSAEEISVVTEDGARLRVHAYGPEQGDVIVLIHGWSCCVEYWNPQINEFAGEFRVIAYDQRCHGESEWGTKPFGAEQLAGDLSAVLDAVLRPAQRAVLVGHSMGGMTIQAWAQHYPKQVAQRASAIVLATTAARQIPGRATIIPMLGGGHLPAPVWVARSVFGAPVPLPGFAVARKLFQSRIMTPDCDPELVEFALSIVRGCSPTVRGAVARDLSVIDLGEAASHITVPTSVIAGEYDKLLPTLHSIEIADLLAEKGSLDRLLTLPAGHLVNLEAPAEFNAEIRRMIHVGRRKSSLAS